MEEGGFEKEEEGVERGIEMMVSCYRFPFGWVSFGWVSFGWGFSGWVSFGWDGRDKRSVNNG